jgi:hypothetical protein
VNDNVPTPPPGDYTPAEQRIYDAAKLRGRLEAILAGPYTDEVKILKISELLTAEEGAEQTRWADTGSGAGYTEPPASHLLRQLRAEVAALRDEVEQLRDEIEHES